MADGGDPMRNEFENLRRTGQTNINSLILWLTEAFETPEVDVTRLFDNVQDRNNITFDEFNEILARLAGEMNIPMDQVTAAIMAVTPHLKQALEVAADIIRDLAKEMDNIIKNIPEPE